MQIERLPAYVATLNPGWDPSLPLYKPLAMFEAEKAALTKPNPKPGPWDHAEPSQPKPPATPPSAAIRNVAFIGDEKSPLFRRLANLGVPLDSSAANAKFAVVDGDSLTASTALLASRAIDSLRNSGGTVLLMFGGAKSSPEQIKSLLPGTTITDRPATALVPNPNDALTSGFSLPDLYFAEEGNDRYIMRHGIDGPLVAKGRMLLPRATPIGIFSMKLPRSPNAPPRCSTSTSGSRPERL